MRTLRLLCSLVLLLTGLPAAYAQVVTTEPVFFRDTDEVTIFFDAKQGNRGLANHTGDVFIYTGVITPASTTPSDWKHVKNANFGAPTPAERMMPLGNGRYSITFVPRTFYPGLTAAEKILRLAMVFRGPGGSPEGKGTNNTDIFVDVAQGDLTVRFTSPAVTAGNPLFVDANQTISVSGVASLPATLTLTLNGAEVTRQANTTTITANVSVAQSGLSTLRLTATAGTATSVQDLEIVVRDPVTVAALPVGAKDGVTYLAGGASVILNLTAPNKQSVYVLGDFNDWKAGTAGLMKKTPDGNRWWVQIDGLTPGREYAYQYLVDENLRVADPYSRKILDPNNDRSIPEVTYPAALLQYPTGKTTGIVSTFQSGQAEYQWQVNNFQKPKRTDLVVYELLVRDFIARHDYKTLTDTLNYLQRLGVNAIELMPVNEFEGNESWGYNPSFYFTPDKYYGTKDDLKRFIDECHRRGIAVILDMVLNHSFGQSPMVQMYFADGAPTAESPWFNRAATHPFNVGYDFNHESPFTKYFVERVNEFWLQEYRIDGYRYDLSKGFTQRNNPNNVAAWGRKDDSRIAIWKGIYDQLRSIDPNFYCILEHLSDNDEEKILADYGMMLWGNQNGSYVNAVRGLSSGSDFSGGYFANRGWQQPNLITYMESHDEERLMVRALNEGNQTGAAPGYNVRDPNTALNRMGEAVAFFFTVPGPKMIWQFGELGYDVSINENGRVGNKPIRWEYQQVPARRNLYNVYRSLIDLKKEQSVFESPTTYTQSLSGPTKSIHLTNADLSVTVIGNFDVVSRPIAPAFQSAGTWYSYLSDATLNVSAAELNSPITLGPGEYRVYTSQKISRPQGVVLSTKRKQEAVLNLTAAPNPVAATTTLRYDLKSAAPVTVTITNLLGATVRTLPATPRQAVGAHELPVSVVGLTNGVYLVRLRAGEQVQTTRLVVQH